MRTFALAVVIVSLLACEAAFAATTPSAYRAQASAICTKTDKALNKIPAPKSAAQIGKYFNAVLIVVEAQYNSLRKLSVPSSLATSVSKALTAEKTQITGIRVLSDQIRKGADPLKAMTTLDKTMTAAGDAEDAAWKKLKISACYS